MSVPQLPKSKPGASPVTAELAAMMQPVKFTEISSAAELAIRPNKAFFLRHHPSAWRVSTTLEKPTLLPDVTTHPLEPGVNGVRTTSKGEAPEKAYEDSVHSAEKGGWVYLSPMDEIPAECLPDGVPPGSYLRGLPCKDPRSPLRGTRYIEAWNVPVASLPGEAQEFKFKVAAYERWLLWLVESGVIAPAMPQVAARMVRRIDGHLQNAYNNAGLHPEVRQKRIEAKKKVLEQYKLAESNPAEPVEDKPKKRGARR